MIATWKPIEEAPRDGTVILSLCVYGDNQLTPYPFTILWDEEREGWIDSAYGFLLKSNAKEEEHIFPIKYHVLPPLEPKQVSQITVKTIDLDPDEEKKYRRFVIHSMFTSLFYGVLSERKKLGKDTMVLRSQALSDLTGIEKFTAARLLSIDPYWTIDIIADVAESLDLEIGILARERSTGKVFYPHGKSSDDEDE